MQAQLVCLLQRDGPRCPAVCLRVTRMVSFKWFSRGATKFPRELVVQGRCLRTVRTLTSQQLTVTGGALEARFIPKAVVEVQDKVQTRASGWFKLQVS